MIKQKLVQYLIVLFTSAFLFSACSPKVSNSLVAATNLKKLSIEISDAKKEEEEN